jgi:hypothetical protein
MTTLLLLDQMRPELCFVCFLVGLRFETQDFALTKQAQYHLSHTSSPFYFG